MTDEAPFIQTGQIARTIVASLMITLGAFLVGYGYGYTRLDPKVSLTFFYITVAVLVAEKKLVLPGLERFYSSTLHEKVSLLVFAPSSILFYEIGREYNLALLFSDTFAYFVFSALIGLSLGLLTITISLPYARRAGHG